ncbi:hypothetical protein H0E87_015730 [Populus deltoides]|uniref:Uncharacterized protein n=1 Tax=Populus deltoides TaxID=3696 RepID=A0A8T2Y696_POPDE|nr:hypothetical protein H0E87_015730 [Populus deltoides]
MGMDVRVVFDLEELSSSFYGPSLEFLLGLVMLGLLAQYSERPILSSVPMGRSSLGTLYATLEPVGPKLFRNPVSNPFACHLNLEERCRGSEILRNKPYIASVAPY